MFEEKLCKKKTGSESRRVIFRGTSLMPVLNMIKHHLFTNKVVKSCNKFVND